MYVMLSLHIFLLAYGELCQAFKYDDNINVFMLFGVVFIMLMKNSGVEMKEPEF